MAKASKKLFSQFKHLVHELNREHKLIAKKLGENGPCGL